MGRYKALDLPKTDGSASIIKAYNKQQHSKMEGKLSLKNSNIHLFVLYIGRHFNTIHSLEELESARLGGGLPDFGDGVQGQSADDNDGHGPEHEEGLQHVGEQHGFHAPQGGVECAHAPHQQDAQALGDACHATEKELKEKSQEKKSKKESRKESRESMQEKKSYCK